MPLNSWQFENNPIALFLRSSFLSTMRAIVVERYGPAENFVTKEVPDPGKPNSRDLLVRSVTYDLMANNEATIL